VTTEQLTRINQPVWRPLPDEYPKESIPCECDGKPECRICAGFGYYYLFKRKKGQLLFDEMGQEQNLLGSL
jgi:hypothetical protein